MTSIENADYSKIKSTSEMQSKCLDSVEVLKDLIEDGDLRMIDDIEKVDEFSAELVTHNIQVYEVSVFKV